MSKTASFVIDEVDNLRRAIFDNQKLIDKLCYDQNILNLENYRLKMLLLEHGIDPIEKEG
jgi:hypothetical protein